MLGSQKDSMATSEWSTDRTIQATLTDDNSGPPIQYLAGFFDGEGCFTTNGGGLMMAIGTTKQQEPQMFADLFGGEVHKYVHEEEERSEWSDYYRWLACGRRAKMAAERMYPHLRGKQDQCRVFIEAIEHQLATSRTGLKGGRKEEAENKLEEYRKRVRSFNGGQGGGT